MIDEKVFFDKDLVPNEDMISEALGSVYAELEAIRRQNRESIGETREEWKYYGLKNGWSLKTFLKKRNLYFIGIYQGYFRIAFVFGEKAFQAIMDSDLSAELKSELEGARKYSEGRGLYIKVGGSGHLEDIKKLIRFKIEN